MRRIDGWAGLLAGGVLMLAAGAQAQAPQVTVADYERAARMLGDRTAPLVDHVLVSPAWLDDGSLVYGESVDGQTRWWRVQPGQEPRPAFDPQALAAAANAGDGARAVVAGRLPVATIARDGDALQVALRDGRRFRCDAAGCRPQVRPATGSEPGAPSPDGRREVFIRDWNLWLRDLASGAETQLTFDGQPDYGYATDNAGWKHTDNAVVVWSPDGRKLATFRLDQRKVRQMTLTATNVGAPKVEQWRYPFAGDPDILMLERVIVDLGGGQPRVVRLQLPAEPHRSTCADDLLCDDRWQDVQWAADGKTLAFISTDRGHKSATLRVADAATGKVRDVYTETVATQYQSAPALDTANWRYLPESNEFLWFSQKSDWGHLYLHDLATGKQKRQLTHGDWNVTRIDHYDPQRRTLLVEGVGREPGRDPYFVHAYEVGLDDGRVRLLTPEDANHVLTVAADGRHFLDVASTVDSAPVARLRARDGTLVRELARADLTRLKAAGWVPPQPFTVKARDGKTDLYGQLFKPSQFDPNKKYPIITYIYPGPQVGSVRSRSFLPAHLDHQALAELGFVVMALDGMCTPLRSKAFQDSCYGNMADNTLPDQVAALKQLGERYPWIDTARAGIWGHSGGGNATAAAMFRYPDVYQVGIAESGNHDNLSYEDDWGERYQGLLEKRPDGTTNYTGQDNAPYAKQLKGKLFLLHGLMDDNVPPQSTLLVVDALMKANKDFDLLLLPQARHGFGADSYYVMRRRWDYFVRHLLGAEPPREFALKPLQP